MTQIAITAFPYGFVATVGENFRRFRKAKGITQEQVYRALGFKRQANVSLLERSKALPKPATIRKMAAAIGVSALELLEGVKTPYDLLREEPQEHAQKRRAK